MPELLPYLRGYSPQLLNQVQQLITEQRLGEILLNRSVISFNKCLAFPGYLRNLGTRVTIGLFTGNKPFFSNSFNYATTNLNNIVKQPITSNK